MNHSMMFCSWGGLFVKEKGSFVLIWFCVWDYLWGVPGLLKIPVNDCATLLCTCRKKLWFISSTRICYMWQVPIPFANDGKIQAVQAHCKMYSPFCLCRWKAKFWSVRTGVTGSVWKVEWEMVNFLISCCPFLIASFGCLLWGQGHSGNVSAQFVPDSIPYIFSPAEHFTVKLGIGYYHWRKRPLLN